MGNEVNYSGDIRSLDSALVNGGCNHNRQFSCHLADQRFGYIDIALHGLFHIFAVRIIISVKNADTVRADNVPALEIVHADTFVYDRAFLFQRDGVIEKLGNAAGIHGDVLVCG